MIWFRLSKSRVRPDAECVEVFDGNRKLAQIDVLPQLLGVELSSQVINKFIVNPPTADRAIDVFQVLFKEAGK